MDGGGEQENTFALELQKTKIRKYFKEGSDYASIRVVVVPSEAQNRCGPVQDYTLPAGEECKKKFNAVADQCITGVEERDTGVSFMIKQVKVALNGGFRENLIF